MTLSHLRRPVTAVIAYGVLAGTLVTIACRRPEPPPQAPMTQSSDTPVRVKGTERVAWEQFASSSEQVARYRFIGYVDDMPIDLTDAKCGATPTEGRYPCSARLPGMTPGRHRFALAAEETNGRQLRGVKSGTLILDVQPVDTAK